MTRNIEVGDKVTHSAHGSEVGVVAHIWADGSVDINFPDGEYGVEAGSPTLVEKNTTPKPAARFRPVRPETFRLGHTHAEFESFLRAHATIRVQLPEASVPSFEAKYKSTTGENVVAPSEFVSIIDESAKWGLSITVLFPASGKHLVPDWLTVGSNKLDDPDALGIFSTDFGWELLSKGFRLGRKHEHNETAFVHQF